MTHLPPSREPEPRYGWVMVAIAFVFGGLSFGGLVSVGVFLKPLAAEFGWSRGEISFGYTISGLATVTGVFWGYLADRFGTRRLIVLGSVTMALALALLSRQAALWQYYTIFLLFGLFGQSVLGSPLYTNVGFWFTRNKGLALGAAAAGGAMGQAVVPYLAQMAITEHGWRAAYLSLAIGYALIGIPLALLVRDSPARIAAARGGPQPAHDFPLPPMEATAWLAAAVVFCCSCMAVPIVHLIPMVSDRGIDPQTAAGVLAVLMLAGTAGRVLGGKLTDHIGSLRAYAAASLGQTVLVVWFPHVTSLTGLYVLAAVFGFIYSGVMTSILVCVREMIPVRVNARAMGVVVFFAWIGMGFGGYQGGAVFDLTGDYVWSYANAGIAGLINLTVIAALALRIRGRRSALQAA